MAKTVGTYYFTKLRRNWGIWVIESIINNVTSAAFVKTVYSYEDAVKETYSLNGWGTPKNIVRKF